MDDQQHRWCEMKWQTLSLLMILIPLTFCFVKPAQAEEKVLLGRIEEALLLPQGLRLPARMDTGAATCSLDARDLEIKDNTVQFKLPEAYGALELRLPVVRWGHVRSATTREKRPVVRLEIRLGPKLLRVEANLTDRSQFKYPLLIGRNALKQGFVVDVSKRNIAPPDGQQRALKP
jgi:hypothetical protein